uniref:Polycystin 1, transient receptor potential channel interacting n=1 Tax=Chelonoidis abingdonii TaxID=106734 RepID=A0A8C0GYM7_CHEAB
SLCDPSPSPFLLYSYLHPGTQSQASCHALCSQKAHTYYGLDLEDRCLCGSLGSKGAVDCGKVCSNEIRSCGSERDGKGPSHGMLRDGDLRCDCFQYPCSSASGSLSPLCQVSLSLSARPHSSLHEVIEFTAETLLPGTLYAWDFGDGGEQFSSSSPRARHMYALPGIYVVTVRAQVGGRSLLHSAAVSVILPVGPVGIECPRAVGRGESINIWIHSQQGTDLSILWRMKMPSGQETLGEILQGVYLGSMLAFVLSVFLPGSAGMVWIGLSSLGSLHWVDGSLVDSFQNWTPFGQPKGKESCVQMHLLNPEGVWSSSPCSAKSPFLCEKRAGGTICPADTWGGNVFMGWTGRHFLADVSWRLGVDQGLVTAEAVVAMGDDSFYVFQVLLPREEISVYPDDIIGIQHNAGVSSLLRCLQHSHSPWRQSYISLVKAGWWEGSISSFTNPTWVDHVVCDLRVAFVGKPQSFAATPPLARHSERGAYTYTATVRNAVSSRQMNCTVEVQTKIGGLQIIHPTLVNGKFNVATKKDTLIVIKILSGCHAVAHWMAPVGKAGVLFEATCPGSIIAFVPACRRDTADTWFSSTLLRMEEPRMETLNVLVSNEISTQKLSMKIESYNAIKGLRVVPPGPRRMLVDMSQVGHLAAVIKPALSSRASLQHLGPPCGAVSLCRWGFGDGSPDVESLLSPPYDSQLSRPDPQGERVQVLARVTHMYTQPGKKGADGEGSAWLRRALSPSSPLVNEVTKFKALPRPSPYGIVYSWNFNDGSPTQEGVNSLVHHRFEKSGVYNVMLRANNNLSEVPSDVAVMVSEGVAGLRMVASGPTELGAATVVNAALASGTDVLWTFNMGDGFVYSNLNLSFVSHTFAKEGNYTVTVMAHNAATSTCVSTIAEVYRLQITKILAPICLSSGEQTPFQAVVTGPSKGVQFCWDFQDGNPPAVGVGDPTVFHSYPVAGSYKLNLTVRGTVSTTSCQLAICVEDRIRSVKLTAPTLALALGEPTCFQAEVVPVPDPQHQYQYHWDFDVGEDPVTSGSPEITFTYLEGGSYRVTVTVWNMVSRHNASADILAQRVIGTISILHSGETESFLALGTSYLFTAEVPWDSAATFLWNFGDHSPPQVGQSTFHTYHTAGDITVTVTGENQVSRRNASLDVTVLAPVQLLALSTERPVCEVRQEVAFHASLAAGDQVRYLWAIGQPRSFHQGPATFSHTFPAGGVFVVFVTAENAVSTEKANITIEVQERAQGVQIHSRNVVQGRYLASAEPFMLNAKVTQGSNITFRWVISQGLHRVFTATGQSLTYCYNASGELLVEVRAGNVLGEASAGLALQVVERACGVKVQAASDSVAVGKPVNLSVSVASGTDLLYSWHIEEHAQLLLTTSSSLSYAYSTLGSKLVFVTVSNVLGSSNGSTELRVQEPVSRVSFAVEGSSPPFFLMSDTSRQLWGSVAAGSDVAWEWQLRGKEKQQLFHGQNISCEFSAAGVYQVDLRAWNDVSEDTVQHPMVVQDPVAGLAVEVDRQDVCTDDRVVFMLHAQRGTNVSYALTVPSLGLSLDVRGGTHHFSFPTAGSHQVLALASNNVSTQLVSVVVQVLEKVRGLHIPNCCPAIMESNKELALMAQVRAGENVTFFWIFHLPGHPAYEAAGQQVGYVPPGAGNLTIHVEASNPFCAASLTVTVALQVPIKAATLSSNGTGAFLNQTVAFDVVVMGGSDFHSEWKFGDSEATFAGSRDERMFHHYGHAGDFLVEVKIYNEVSFVLVQTTVTVRELGCDSPMVRLVEPPSSVPRSLTSYFEASIDLKGCTAYKALYLWEVFSSPSCEQLAEADQVPLQHADLLTPSLTLPKLSLDIGTHCLRFTASLQHTPLTQTLSLLITVIPSKLVPVIRGGSWRSWSAQLDLVLDGSGSYDPDVGTAADSSLEYYWDCEVTKGTQKECLSHSPQLACGRGWGSECPGEDGVGSDSRGGQMPSLEDCRSCSALSSYEISRSVHVTLAGQCQSCDNRTMYKWTAQSSDGQNLTLNHVTTSTGDSNRDLVIRQGVLRDGVNYSFTLSASQPGGELQGGSSITLTPNNPPRGGVCTLTPEHHLYLLETLVSYQCTGNSAGTSFGSPVQLIYTLIAEQCSPDGRHCQHFCLYRGIKSSFSTFLPAAIGGSRTTVNVLVELEDSQGAKTLALNRTLTLAMPVLPAGFPTVTSWLKNKSQSELWGVVQQGNPQEVIPYSLALITVLNQNSGSQGNEEELRDRISIRSNVTAALASLNISSVKEVAQLSAALQQCVVGRGSYLFSPGLGVKSFPGSTLSALDTAPHPPLSGASGLSTALTAFNLTRALMKSLMRSRVLNEETLLLSVSEIRMQGKRANSPNLLCLAPSERCLFSVPSTAARQLAGSQEVVQVLMDISVNPFPFNYYANSSISTRLALLEFTTSGGVPIPVSNLSGEMAIGLRLPTGQQEQQSSPPTLILLPPGESVNFTVRALAGSRAKGVHIRVGVTMQEGESQEREPSIHFYGHYTPVPNEFHYGGAGILCGVVLLNRKLTSVLSPLPSSHSFNGTLRDYHVNITNRFSQAPVSAAVTVFASLCQYFHFPSMQWSTEGLRPTAATSRKEIVCLTEHLTVFGASLFVPPHSILFLPPVSRAWPSGHARRRWLVTVPVSVMGTAGILLDDIDITRVGIVPRCGQPGRYKYWVTVKTGWKRGSGTTAHVGISLYGLNKSGSRHLDKGWAFQRNSQDIFQVETDANLGEIWKIRIWHDNTGLDPSWYLQHVIVWDRQTDHMYFFLVDDWLSVENEQNEGLVEKEVLASCECFSRVFPAQLRLGFSDWHVWLSIWGRSPHSRFTRVQRITCCVLAVYLFLAICVLWYGAIGVEGYSVPLGSQVSVTAESVAVGMVVAVVLPSTHNIYSQGGKRNLDPSPEEGKLTESSWIDFYNLEMPNPAPVQGETVGLSQCCGQGRVMLSLWGLSDDGSLNRTTLVAFPAGVSRRPLEWLFPGWVLPMTYAFIFLLLAGCFTVTILYGSSLHDHTALMWLISCIFSFITSFVLLEPLKVVLEALRAALITKPVDSEGEGLVEEPLVKPVPERIGKVRVPCGYGLLQAKEEARKVRALRVLMRSCLTHLLFLLVVLTVNYQSCFHHRNIHLLHTAVRQALTAPNDRGLNFSSIRRRATNQAQLPSIPEPWKIFLLSPLFSTLSLHDRTRAVFLEFTQYNADVNLYVVVMLLLELPSVRLAVPSIFILPYQMLRLGTGLDLSLVLISLLVFSMAFLLAELSLLSQEGASCLGQSRCWLQLLLALLSIAVGALHFAHIWLADVRLEHYWGHRQAFTSFYEVALLAQMEVCLSALLLTITTLKIVQQLRFVRRWSAFGKTFQHALQELVAAMLIFLLLLLVYAQCGYLVGYAEEFPTLGTAYVLSFTVSLLCVGSRFLCAVILHSYRTVQAEMYRPAMEPQDYEMIEFFVKRFKLWMGLSKTKEFRHKVKFEGMDSLISRSSGNSKRSHLLSAGTIFRCASSTISSISFSSEELALSESPVPEQYNVQFYLDRLPSAVNNLLDQFDRVIRVMEDVCQLESSLEQAQKRINDNKKGQKSLQGEKVTLAKQLELPRTYSTFSESALVRLRSHRAKVSNCNATDGHKLVQQPPADGVPNPVAGCTSWLVGPPISTDLCHRRSQAPGISCKWRPKSEEEQGCLCHEVPQRQIPLKRRAWQTEGAGNM